MMCVGCALQVIQGARGRTAFMHRAPYPRSIYCIERVIVFDIKKKYLICFISCTKTSLYVKNISFFKML